MAVSIMIQLNHSLKQRVGRGGSYLQRRDGVAKDWSLLERSLALESLQTNTLVLFSTVSFLQFYQVKASNPRLQTNKYVFNEKSLIKSRTKYTNH